MAIASPDYFLTLALLSSLTLQDQNALSLWFQEQVEERDKLEREEQRYWREYSKYKRELLMAEDDFRSLDCQVAQTYTLLTVSGTLGNY